MTDGRSQDGGAVDVYWLPYCSTCQKAVAHLRERGVPIRSWRNLKEQPLSEDEVRGLAAKASGIDKLFSRRAMKYRQTGLHEQQLSDDDLVRLMAQEYTFVTRPVPSSSAAAARPRGSRRSGWTSWSAEAPQ